MAYKIPLFDLNFGEEEIQAVADTINSNWISTGPKCEELEQQFVDKFYVKHAVSMSNCTDALHLACILCGIKEGDEVICPSLTFAASANCIRYVGAHPVFADISSFEDINIDPKDIEKKITPKTKAIIVVHMAGFPANMDEIMAIANKYNLRVIEDACHGPLSEYKGKKLGTIGDVGCFSFFSNKNISTGEGGMLITNNDDYAKKARLLRSHGMTTMSYQRAGGHATSYDIVELGYNYRMDDIRASIGLVQMKKLPKNLQQRLHVRKWYNEKLQRVKGVILPFAQNEEFVSNYIMPIVLKDSNVEKRDRVREKLHAAGIQTSVHYPAIHKFSIYKQYGAILPTTDYVTDNEITLPMYAALTEDEIDFIVETLDTAVNE
ncbi:DegT/DnrJ/EryC1/StrS family aminotransferase [Haoranjiania flava]|uniref:DegT/DnrJ/EryC1/StrS family aminotransferase n=1 Tax=Haoranjiania flava TaxID=1856322 RepID=A0AAE3LQM4_9BACT|nr:DegT/DnrJ/EryC1/StrS family aminotransferase [Haoranjiania flava]MCU7694605.1 DegT/DnrJ/EryC1/StrS family aminotransferase [Haoranjiania flava]